MQIRSYLPRRRGATTSQLRNAPYKALYVWPHSRTDYVCDLAKKLGRDDLYIVGPSRLRVDRLAGRTFSAVVLDHACHPNEEEWEQIVLLRQMARTPKEWLSNE